MRRLVALIGAIVLVDTSLYAALAPLLPTLEREFDLTKAQSGVLIASYAVGTFAGALPGGWAAARYGARATVVGGLALMTVSGVWFAHADSAVGLDVARFAQGIGGALSWTAGLAWVGHAAPRERRGEALGVVIGAGIFGGQFGPVLGVAAEHAGRGVVFTAVAALGIVLAALALTQPRPEPVHEDAASPTTLLRDRPWLAAAWLTVLPSLAFGVAETLVPLRLDEIGASALGIGAAFLVAALMEAVLSPVVGRVADRRGARMIVRGGTLLAAASVALLAVPSEPLAVSVIFVFGAVGLGALWVPSGTLVSRRAETLRVDQGWAFAVNNLGWSGGVALGALAGGALGQLVGDGLPYGLAAALLLGTALLASRLVPSHGS